MELSSSSSLQHQQHHNDNVTLFVRTFNPSVELFIALYKQHAQSWTRTADQYIDKFEAIHDDINFIKRDFTSISLPTVFIKSIASAQPAKSCRHALCIMNSSAIREHVAQQVLQHPTSWWMPSTATTYVTRCGGWGSGICVISNSVDERIIP